MSYSDLPHLNASLNGIATILLIIGFVLIKKRKEHAHKIAMLSAFGVSTLFLISYVIYHANMGSRKFPSDDYSQLITYGYLFVLATHVVLAALVLFLAIGTIVFALLDKRKKHLWLAKFTFPIWLYVSLTGVLVYFMLYHWFLPIES